MSNANIESFGGLNAKILLGDLEIMHDKDVVMHEQRAGDTQEAALVPVEVVPESRTLDLRRKDLPAAIQEAGAASGFAYEEFLFGHIPNPSTHRAYQAAVNRFLEWLRLREVSLGRVTPRDVGDCLDSLNLAIPSKKLHRAALNHFFDFQVQRHAVVLNPVSSVRNERDQVTEGRTPEITVEQARRMFGSIEGSTVVGLRERAAIAVLAYSGSRIGTVARLRRRDLLYEGDQWVIAFNDKGGKHRKVPVRHDLQRILFAYLEAAGITELDGDLPIFRSSKGKKGALSTVAMTDNDLQRMFKRRLRKAGLPPNRLSPLPGTDGLLPGCDELRRTSGNGI
ncbi:MAG: tyrosine-type recombinase/integrase [Verrucomicrobia bacterium]|nr:tyrosine-type recombinase/integrase [Verrucomicrobiota bacterium]OQC65931.1 MAG: site-specific tyrosine recombinase XerC [Verrucomicrobia bacterium ADurb.Bin006]MDI9382246.1 tyrosine-type recombinase/integrase [Verrucomicrobiota bacterium]NMD18858.1 tyrosine-type recombinase/integrase [Verrucomicrobiota bacterium]HOA62237.1 tyrosine-type recombinase/integrase [Verrucomicrobiota bacterium]